MGLIPIVIEKEGNSERAFDIYSRLLRDRIIVLGEEITDHTANVIVAQMIFLEQEDSDNDIHFYIQSPGGYVTATMAIYDTMQFIRCDVQTICMGMAASGAALLLTAGTKGKRIALPNSDMMIHQPLGYAQGQATDIDIHARRILKMRKKYAELLSHHTGKPLKTIQRDIERDFFMSAEEAVKYGLIDAVVDKREDVEETE